MMYSTKKFHNVKLLQKNHVDEEHRGFNGLLTGLSESNKQR